MASITQHQKWFSNMACPASADIRVERARGLCHGTSGQSLVCHCAGLGLLSGKSARDLWCKSGTVLALVLCCSSCMLYIHNRVTYIVCLR